MTEKSFWWTTGGAGDGASTYTRDDLAVVAKVLAAAGGDYKGVVPSFLNSLGMNATAANQVTIDTGGAVVDGKPYQSNATVNVTIPSAVGVGNTRIDTIVLECDWTAQTVRIKRVAGTDAASPTAPTLAQNSGTLYQLALWNVTVNTSGAVTTSDARDWARFSWMDSGTSGFFLKRNSSDANGVSWGLPIMPGNCARLSLSSTTPYPNADITAATTLYLHPVNGEIFDCYDGAIWRPYQIPGAGISISLASILNNTNYDVFVYASGSNLALELLAWSSATVRATALVWSTGRLVKSGAITRRYVGTIRASAAGQCEDSAAKRFVWSYFNRTKRIFRNTASGTHSYSTASNRWWNNSATGSSVEIVTGYDGNTSPIDATGMMLGLQAACTATPTGASFGFWNGTTEIGLARVQPQVFTTLTILGNLNANIGSWNFPGYQQIGVFERGDGSTNLTSTSMAVEGFVEG